MKNFYEATGYGTGPGYVVGIAAITSMRSSQEYRRQHIRKRC